MLQDEPVLEGAEGSWADAGEVGVGVQQEWTQQAAPTHEHEQTQVPTQEEQQTTAS
jgi:hypothetical protein